MIRARVLLLEDDPVPLDVTRDVLEDERLDVTVCGTLNEKWLADSLRTHFVAAHNGIPVPPPTE